MSEDRPTHREKATGALVWPQGYDPADLEKLPENFYEEHGRVEALREARAKRDRLLAATDAYMVPDRLMRDERRAAWVAYRQALRDLPDQGEPHEIIWPEPPSPP